jgi:hypothetical protein
LLGQQLEHLDLSEQDNQHLMLDKLQHKMQWKKQKLFDLKKQWFTLNEFDHEENKRLDD